MRPIRPRATLAAVSLALAACAGPDGTQLPLCEFDVPEAQMRIARPGGAEPQVIPIRCWRHHSRERIEIRFLPPGGPTCYRLERVELQESAEAIALTVVVSRDRVSTAGACPAEAMEAATQIELQAPLDDRRVLDGAHGE